ncbi:MAG: hypothetical protein HFH10_15435 [Dorea sp.]|nr:hypothetical protein [Dorea sp.]
MSERSQHNLICVAGKNNIAVAVLEYLVKNRRDRYELGIICNQNESGKNTWQKSLRFYARQNGISEYRLEEIYTIRNLIFISLEFDSIVRPERFADARLYNIHFSLLPQYKGMYTSAVPILNGEEYVGVTFHKIDRGIDTGDIIAQKRFELKDSYTSRDLYAQYISNGTKLVLEHIEAVIENRVYAVPQPQSKSSYYSKFYIDYTDLKIDLRQTADMIKRQIRAFSFREYQLPVVYGHQIIAAEITDTKSTKKPGTVLTEQEHGMVVSTIDYNILLHFDRFEELLDACQCGDLSKVKDICVVDAHINAANGKGWTPLIVATYNNHLDIVRYLLVNGADPHARSNNGTNLLMYAKDAYLNSGSIELFRLFYNMGIDVKEQDYAGKDLAFYLQKDGLNVEDLINEAVAK